MEEILSESSPSSNLTRSQHTNWSPFFPNPGGGERAAAERFGLLRRHLLPDGGDSAGEEDVGERQGRRRRRAGRVGGRQQRRHRHQDQRTAAGVRRQRLHENRAANRKNSQAAQLIRFDCFLRAPCCGRSWLINSIPSRHTERESRSNIGDWAELLQRSRKSLSS